MTVVDFLWNMDQIVPTYELNISILIQLHEMWLEYHLLFNANAIVDNRKINF